MRHVTTQLVHYTRDAATVGSIIRKGFLLIICPVDAERELRQQLPDEFSRCAVHTFPR